MLFIKIQAIMNNNNRFGFIAFIAFIEKINVRFAMNSKGKIRVFNDAVAVVTGGASGIGRAVVNELVNRGAQVVIADLQIELAEELASEIRAKGGKADAVKLDVTDFCAVEKVVKDTVKTTGRIDYMFNNAGIMFMGDVDKYSIDDWNFTVDINMKGVINGVQAVYNIMSRQGFGHIVNTASMAGLIPTAGSIAYAATKHGVVGLSKALIAEASMKNIGVTVFCPGVIRTPIMTGGKFGRNIQNLSKKQEKSFLDSIEKIKPMDPALFAKKAIDSVAKKKFIVILPRWNKLFWIMDRISPTFGLIFSKFGYKNIKKSLNN